MKNVIFGSGIVGLVAKKILVGDWTIIPFNRSRFYSYNPPLADNFISSDKDVDALMRDLTGSSSTSRYRRSYSMAGQLVNSHDADTANMWLSKIYNKNSNLDLIPGQAMAYLSNRLNFPIYQTRANELYQQLQNEYLSILKQESSKGQVTEIGKNFYVRGGVREEFDNALCTIPLKALLELLGKDASSLTFRNDSLVLVKSSTIDLEGYNQVYVADSILDFYKVTNIAPQLYMFYFLEDIPIPGKYLMPIIGAADIIDGTKISESIPTGQTPDLSWLETFGITCIGSYAQHDWLADVGSNLLRLVRYGQKGYK